MNVDDFSPPIYEYEPVGLTGGEREVAFANAFMESRTFIVNAGFRLTDALIPFLRARKAGVQVDVDQHGDVGLQTLAGNSVKFEDCVRREAPAAALIDHRGVRKAITQHNGARLQSGADHLFHVLRSTRKVEQQFGARVDLRVYGVEKDPANLLTDVGAARLDGFDNAAAAAAKRTRKQAKLRRLAAPVNSFERDKTTAWFQTFNFRKCFSAASARFSWHPAARVL
jgi:hypothetical protein